MARSLNIVQYKIFDPQEGIYYDFNATDLSLALTKRQELITANSSNSALTDLHYITGVSLNESGQLTMFDVNVNTLNPNIVWEPEWNGIPIQGPYEQFTISRYTIFDPLYNNYYDFETFEIGLVTNKMQELMDQNATLSPSFYIIGTDLTKTPCRWCDLDPYSLIPKTHGYMWAHSGNRLTISSAEDLWSLSVVKYQIFDPVDIKYFDFVNFNIVEIINKIKELVKKNANNYPPYYIIGLVPIEATPMWIDLSPNSLNPFIENFMWINTGRYISLDADNVFISKYQVYDPVDHRYYDFESFETGQTKNKLWELGIKNSNWSDMLLSSYIIGISVIDGQQCWFKVDCETLRPIIS
jgi:hypothetical protein